MRPCTTSWVSPRGHPSHIVQDYEEWKEVGYKHLLPRKFQNSFFLVHYRILVKGGRPQPRGYQFKCVNSHL